VHHSSRANTNSAAAQDRFLFFIMIPFRFGRFVPAAYQAPCCGADYPHGMQKGSGAVPDYKAMYFELFRASVQAVQLLQDAGPRRTAAAGRGPTAAAAGAARWGRVNPLSLTASPSPSLLRKSTSPSGRAGAKRLRGRGYSPGFTLSLPPPWPQTCRCGSQSARGCRRPPGLFRRAGSL